MRCEKNCEFCNCENLNYFALCIFNYRKRDAINSFLREIKRAKKYKKHLSICSYSVTDENAVFIDGYSSKNIRDTFLSPAHEDNLFWYCEGYGLWAELWGRNPLKQVEEHFMISDEGVCVTKESARYIAYPLLDSYKEFCSQSFACEQPITELVSEERWENLKLQHEVVKLDGLDDFPCDIFRAKDGTYFNKK